MLTIVYTQAETGRGQFMAAGAAADIPFLILLLSLGKVLHVWVFPSYVLCLHIWCTPAPHIFLPVGRVLPAHTSHSRIFLVDAFAALPSCHNKLLALVSTIFMCCNLCRPASCFMALQYSSIIPPYLDIYSTLRLFTENFMH